MAASKFVCEQYTSEEYVASVGAVLFRLSTQEICLLHRPKRGEYMLAKGRRNCWESRQEAAAREVTEECGYPCHLLNLSMSTRAPAAVEVEHLADEARFYMGICETFTLQIRHLGVCGIKFIWWYIAAVNENEPLKEDRHEMDKCTVKFYSFTEVLEKLTFQMDRDMVKKAIDIFSNTVSK
ncbi:MAG: hypothetical protein Q9182_002598 [Xanthomendoza sp. 2 TL-2023]